MSWHSEFSRNQTRGESDAKSADDDASFEKHLIDRRRPGHQEAEHQPLAETPSDDAPRESAADEISRPIPSDEDLPVLFPKASSPPDASDRGALPLNGAPVAPIVVVRLQYRTVAAESSQAGNDGWGRVQRFASRFARLSPIFSGRRGTSPGALNFFGPFEAARRFFCTLRQLRQEARGVFAVLFSPSLSCVALAHGNHHEQERLECLTNLLKEPTK